ncbi:MAG: four helix bundle protein [Raineya sp.]
MEKEEFNEMMRNKTKDIAVRVVKMYAKTPKNDEFIVIGKQMVRSATSVAANYRAACRARSVREFFAKISIVIEEADETLFWLEILEEAEIIHAEKLSLLKNDITEVLKIVATARKNTKI